MLFLLLFLLGVCASAAGSQNFGFLCGFGLDREEGVTGQIHELDVSFYQSGTVRPLILFGKFKDAANPFYLTKLKDQNGNETQSSVDILNPDHTGSLAHYFKEMSYGALTLEDNDDGVEGMWFEGARTKATDYSTPCSDGIQEFAKDVFADADDTIDFSDYDRDGDGVVDLVILYIPKEFIDIGCFAGTVLSYSGFDYSTGDSVSINENIIYVIQRPSFPYLVGVTAHEYGHVINLPDLYDRSQSSAGIGFWGVMGLGPIGWSWNPNEDLFSGPNPLSVWSRYKVGWITSDNGRLATVESDMTNTTLNDINSKSSTVKAYKIPVRGSEDEYFLMANRQNTHTENSQGGYYDDLAPASGLAIWHIDDGLPISSTKLYRDESNNNEKHKRVDLECADGLYDNGGFGTPGNSKNSISGGDNLDYLYTEDKNGNTGDATDLWTSGAFTPDSNPSTAAYSDNDTPNDYSDDLQDVPTGIAVRNIQALSGGVMQVDIVFLPLEPENLRAEAGAGQVTLRWDAPMPNGGSAITGYKYRQSADEGRTWTAETSVAGGSTARSQTVRQLVAGTRYTFEVRAVNAAGSGTWASATATAGYRRIHVDWPPVSSATGYDVQVQSKPFDRGMWPSAWSSLATNSLGRPRGTSRRYAHTGVSPDSLYRYQMRSRTGTVVSAWSAPTAGVQPGVGPPEGFSAEAGASQVTLRWTGPDHASITKWRYRDVTALGDRTQGGWQDAAVSGSASTEWSALVADLTPGQAYRFQVRAVNGAGGGQPSAVSNAVTPWLARPTGGSVSKGAGPALEVAWSPVASATGYEVQGQRRFYEGGAWPATWTQQQANGAQPYVHRGVDADSLYRYRVRARMGAVVSAWSDMLPGVGGVQPPPSVPTGLTATAGNRQVTLTWTGPTHTSITGWQYQRGHISEPTTAWSGWLPLSSAATTRTFTVTSALSNGRSYVFQVRAGNAGGWSAAAQSDTVLLVRPADTPGRVALSTTAPQVGDDLTATLIDPDAPSKAGFSWAYLVPAGASGANGEVASSRTSLSSTLQVSTVLLGVRLLSKVSYTDEHGPQQAVSDTTAAVVGPPWAPRTFTATAGDEQVALSWKVPSKIGGSAITRYAYRYKETSGGVGSQRGYPGPLVGIRLQARVRYGDDNGPNKGASVPFFFKRSSALWYLNQSV